MAVSGVFVTRRKAESEREARGQRVLIQTINPVSISAPTGLGRSREVVFPKLLVIAGTRLTPETNERLTLFFYS